MAGGTHSTNGYQPRVVELHLFVPASDGVYHSMLQEDDGLSFAALQDGRYRTTFTVARAGADLTLNADVSGTVTRNSPANVSRWCCTVRRPRRHGSTTS